MNFSVSRVGELSATLYAAPDAASSLLGCCFNRPVTAGAGQEPAHHG